MRGPADRRWRSRQKAPTMNPHNLLCHHCQVLACLLQSRRNRIVRKVPLQQHLRNKRKRLLAVPLTRHPLNQNPHQLQNLPKKPIDFHTSVLAFEFDDCVFSEFFISLLICKLQFHVPCLSPSSPAYDVRIRLSLAFILCFAMRHDCMPVHFISCFAIRLLGVRIRIGLVGLGLWCVVGKS